MVCKGCGVVNIYIHNIVDIEALDIYLIDFEIFNLIFFVNQPTA